MAKSADNLPKLRPYQQDAIDLLYSWFGEHEGNPCLSMPTGSGKSWVIAELCRDVLQNWADKRILMLTHVKELIEQNLEKMLTIWSDAPVGVYSAGIGRRELHQPITFAGIQSVRNRAKYIGEVDLVIVDECHTISHQAEGSYRNLIDELKTYNPNLRVIGLTATPYRMGHGMITDEPAIFNGIIEPISVEELVAQGYLATLRSKITSSKLDTTGVKKRGGEYIESQLQAAVDKKELNESIVDEIIPLAGERKAWLFFCAGINHALHIRDELLERGINAETVTGETPKKERERILNDFKAGKIRALTNANVLTTGFDYPDIDLIAMLRPTESPGLYVQMAGRGLRLKSHTDHCLVLDFAGVVSRHGPITNVNPPPKKGEKMGDAPVRVCDQCGEICHAALKSCPACGFRFPPAPKAALKIHDDDIMGRETLVMSVGSWHWQPHVSRASGKQMPKVTYYGYGNLKVDGVTEYFPITHDGYAGDRAITTLHNMLKSSGYEDWHLEPVNLSDMEYSAGMLNCVKPPFEIHYKKDGKFYRVLRRIWSND